VVKPHGLNGETVVEFVSNRPERSSLGACFETDTGLLRIAAIRPFDGRWLVTFEGVGSRATADALRGTVLRAPAIEDPDALWVHELVGATVTAEGDGASLGTVVAVVSNPASDLLELDDGRLVPVRFVVEHQPGWLVVDVPEGFGP
jgi:16S rRNA processing protein RimM